MSETCLTFYPEMEKEGRVNNCQGLVGMTQASWALGKSLASLPSLAVLTWSRANGCGSLP